MIADEYPLMTMTKIERESALDQAEKYRIRYGYRKKYSNLKKEKFLHYSYTIGAEYNERLAYIYDVSKIRKGMNCL